jgi:6-pyruvoyltetrahydropterin/6-carboxytetrahydropterin synthase
LAVGFHRRRSGATHGHNWELEVTLSGPVDPETGMVIDLKDLKEVMEREVEARFDHRSLNDDTPFFRDRAAPPRASRR